MTNKEPSPAESEYDHVWRSRTHLLDRTGHRLRVIAIGTLNSALIEFSDGQQCVVSRFAYRRDPTARQDRLGNTLRD